MAHPLTRNVGIDHPSAVELRRRIVREKPFLMRIYREWYEQLARGIPAGTGAVLELGAGAGFLREFLAEVIVSDVIPHPEADIVLDAMSLPVGDGALRAIVMLDVLHHLYEPRRFFTEAARCVRPGGAMVMIEPWVTTWSKFVYGKLHHEPFRPDAPQWEFPSTGPLSGANEALPWMLFERDRAQFAREFPQWALQKIEVQMPFRYMVSGGVSLRSLTPAWSFNMWRGLEHALQPWMRRLGMFAFISLERTSAVDIRHQADRF